jgi:hypothetical protein
LILGTVLDLNSASCDLEFAAATAAEIMLRGVGGRGAEQRPLVLPNYLLSKENVQVGITRCAAVGDESGKSA